MQLHLKNNLFFTNFKCHCCVVKCFTVQMPIIEWKINLKNKAKEKTENVIKAEMTIKSVSARRAKAFWWTTAWDQKT